MPFAPLFSDRVWQHVPVRVLGAIRSPNPRTVTAALRAMGLRGERNWCKYHRMLSRAQWSALASSRILLGWIVLALVATGALIL